MVSLPLVNVWNQRRMILHFAILNIKQRFKGTYLGFLWMALEPTLLFLLLFTVFTSIKIRGGENFPIYLLTSIILFHIFTRGTMAGLSSLSSNKGIIKSIQIKGEFFPVMVTTATCLLVFVQVSVFFGLMPFFEFVPSWTIVYLPLVIALLLVLTLGFSYLFSIINVYVKDFQIAWGLLTHALFFVTPILWYVQDASPILLQFHQFNPVGQIIELGHNIVVFRQVPPLTDWLYATIFSIAVFFIGFAIFKKFEQKVAEEL